MVKGLCKEDGLTRGPGMVSVNNWHMCQLTQLPPTVNESTMGNTKR